MAIPQWMWKLLGGSTDAAGQPELDPGARVEVFEGYPHDAKALVTALVDLGLHPTDDTYCPAIWPYNPEDPRGRVFVPVDEVAAAQAVVDELPHLGNQMGEPGPSVFPGVVGPSRRVEPRPGAGSEAEIQRPGRPERPTKHRGWGTGFDPRGASGSVAGR